MRHPHHPPWDTLRMLALVSCTVAAGCAGGDSAGPAATTGDLTEDCVDDAKHFADTVQPDALDAVCMACHTATGAASESDLILVTNARPDQTEVNRAALAHVGGLERDGQSLLLLKPLGLENHGGGKVLSEGDPTHQALVAFLERLDNPIVCEGVDEGSWDEDNGLELLTASATLRKAALGLLGRLPTTEESETVRRDGEEGLREVLTAYSQTDAFAHRIRSVFADVLLTDRYLRSNDGLDLLDEDRFPGSYWFDYISNSTEASAYRAAVADSVAREPLALLEHIVHNNLPFTELLTADYTMVNAYTAQSYGVPSSTVATLGDPASEAYTPAQIPGVSHAGVLSTPAFLARFPTTDTNKNRHRSWFFHKTFLDTDILKLADRPIDPTTSNVHNPTSNDPQCAVCHEVMDPVAGAFQNYDDNGRYNPPELGWNPEMKPPGFGDKAMPGNLSNEALAWLGTEAVTDPRFPRAIVRHVLHGLTGVPRIYLDEAAGDPVQLEAEATQSQWVAALAEQVAGNGFSLQEVAIEVVMSPWYRAIGDGGATEGTLATAGTARLLTPEELDTRIQYLLGIPWSNSASSDAWLRDDYNMLYGGIDHFTLITRLTEPNGVMANVGLRMATEMSCEAVPRDLGLPMHQRRLFPWVEISYEPLTDQGFAVPEAEQAIRENIRFLHQHLLGETLPLTDVEVDATYALWFDTWQEGKQLVADGVIDDDMDSDCRATSDWYTGVSLPDDMEVGKDERYTIRAWMAVTTYLLSDIHFLYE